MPLQSISYTIKLVYSFTETGRLYLLFYAKLFIVMMMVCGFQLNDQLLKEVEQLKEQYVIKYQDINCKLGKYWTKLGQAFWGGHVFWV